MDPRACTRVLQSDDRRGLSLLRVSCGFAAGAYSARRANGHAGVRYAIVAGHAVFRRCRHRSDVLGSSRAAGLLHRVGRNPSERDPGIRGSAPLGNDRDHLSLGASPVERLCLAGPGAGFLHLQQGPATHHPLLFFPVARRPDLGMAGTRNRHACRCRNDLWAGYIAGLRCHTGGIRTSLPVRHRRRDCHPGGCHRRRNLGSHLSVVRGLDKGVRVLSNVNSVLR